MTATLGPALQANCSVAPQPILHLRITHLSKEQRRGPRITQITRMGRGFIRVIGVIRRPFLSWQEPQKDVDNA